MIKKTLYFGNPVRLYKKDKQLKIEFLQKDRPPSTIPIEDIGIILLDHYNIQITHALISALQQNNTAIVSCNEKHHPRGIMLPFYGHTEFTEKLRQQIKASQPLKKNLWQQTVKMKIKNQAYLLQSKGVEVKNMLTWASKVKSGDPDNFEARAAAFYWDKLFYEKNFKRHRFGEAPNNLLNYGYAILRAVLARSLVGSGLHPALGIYHSNRYNPFCLVDDIMEPYRPFVDRLVIEIMEEESEIDELTPKLKKKLLAIPVIDLEIQGKKSPLMVGCQQTTASLARCFEGEVKKIRYPGLKAK